MKTLIAVKTTGLAFVCAIIVACSGGSGQENTITPPVNTDEAPNFDIVYEGENAARDETVLAFEKQVWQNLARTDRCGACHTLDGVALPFMRHDDINAAYDLSAPLIDTSSPKDSRLVVKVGGGHNCWDDAGGCAEIIERYIRNMASDNDIPPAEISFVDPELKEFGQTKSFPADTTDINYTTLYQVLTNPNYSCQNCHREDSATRQQPFIASSDIEVSYSAAKSKINLDEPASSRLVQRLKSESHNCWNECSADAKIMEDAIKALTDSIDVAEVDPLWRVSRVMGLNDGIKASSSGRYEYDAIALYEFKPTDNNIALDTSGVDPSLHLSLHGDVEWIGAWGVTLNGGRLQGTVNDSTKLRDRIRASGEYSIEAWVVPFNVTQEGPARIASYSNGSDENGVFARNFLLGQTLYNYDFASRTSESGIEASEMLSTPDAEELLQATKQHIVVTHDQTNGRRIYVNGGEFDNSGEINSPNVTEESDGGSFSNWSDQLALVLGSDIDGQYPWRGSIRYLAIHDHALTPSQIKGNFEADVGQKIYLLFSVSHYIDMPRAYIAFQVEQFDNYSYLFSDPRFISLEEGAVPSGDIIIKGMRIAINGQEAAIGQVFGNMDVTINADNYDGTVGTSLSDLGAIIALDKGPETDQFFLTFEQIGDQTYTRTPEAVSNNADTGSNADFSDMGVRKFAQINATLATMTQVSPTHPDVVAKFEAVKQQLPTSPAADGYLAAHQAGVTQLAVTYCTALVEDETLRASYFAGFNFNASKDAAFDDNGRAAVITPLLKGLSAAEIDDNGTSMTIDTGADPADIELELNNLIDTLTADTPTTVIAICSAAAASAVMLLQ